MALDDPMPILRGISRRLGRRFRQRH